MMWAGAVLGLRWAEAAGLTVDRLDILGGKLTIDRQLAASGQLEPPKSSAGIRTFACPTWLLDELAALLARRGLTAADGDALLFVSPDGAPLHYTNWRRRKWVPACETAKLKGLRFHDLRSLAATALVASGADVKTAQTATRALFVSDDARSLRQSDGRLTEPQPTRWGLFSDPSRRCAHAEPRRRKRILNK